jgi:hypothetical protein
MTSSIPRNTISQRQEVLPTVSSRVIPEKEDSKATYHNAGFLQIPARTSKSIRPLLTVSHFSSPNCQFTWQLPKIQTACDAQTATFFRWRKIAKISKPRFNPRLKIKNLVTGAFKTKPTSAATLKKVSSTHPKAHKFL